MEHVVTQSSGVGCDSVDRLSLDRVDNQLGRVLPVPVERASGDAGAFGMS